MDLVGRMAEALARSSSRRESVKTLAGGAFGVAAAWATQGPVGAGPLAKRCAATSTHADCSPTHGRYCNDAAVGGVKKNCNGATCANNCTVDDGYYQGPSHAGCWCTAILGKGPNRRYYKCCDCLCPDIDPFNGTNPQGCTCREQVLVNKDPNANKPHRHKNH
jgi:hypothetical protein